MRRGNDEKSCGFPANLGGLVGTCISRGGRCWNFSKRLLRLAIMLLDDKDIQLLHRKDIKRRLLVYPSDWDGQGMCLVLVWVIIEANRYENPVVFLRISLAIDLHEGSTFIAEGIFTNSILLAQSRLRICI